MLCYYNISLNDFIVIKNPLLRVEVVGGLVLRDEGLALGVCTVGVLSSVLCDE